MKDNPCYGCEKRHFKCHSSCDDYKQWRIYFEQEKEKERLEKDTAMGKIERRRFRPWH